MIKKKNTFRAKKMHGAENYENLWDAAQGGFSFRKVIISIFTICAVAFILWVGSFLLAKAKILAGEASGGAIKAISKSIGKEMITDEFGHINIMAIGYGGADHDGGYLADAIMVISYNPKDKAVTMLSIPRDLYVNKDNEWIGRINSTLAYKYNRTQNEPDGLDQAAIYFKEKVEEIVGLDIPYYTLIDFNGFEGVIDAVGGVEIDVKQSIYDDTYPDGEKGYMTFQVAPGLQKFDGKTALMYARSRHDSSDFGRSLRQQQVMQAIMHTVLSKENMGSISKIKALYEEYTKMVHTNVTVQEIIGLAQYVDSIDHMFSFGLTTDCMYSNVETMAPGCFLYYPLRENFNGQSVILPDGATPNNVSYYNHIQNFVFYVMHNQGFLIEDPRIVVANGIEDTVRRSYQYNRNGLATNTATKLVKYGFTIEDVENSEETTTQTTIVIHNTGSMYEETIAMLNMQISTPLITTGDLRDDRDITLILGNDYMEKRGTQRFDYNQ